VKPDDLDVWEALVAAGDAVDAAFVAYVERSIDEARALIGEAERKIADAKAMLPAGAAMRVVVGGKRPVVVVSEPKP
jgi:hypothetical protein